MTILIIELMVKLNFVIYMRHVNVDRWSTLLLIKVDGRANTVHGEIHIYVSTTWATNLELSVLFVKVDCS